MKKRDIYQKADEETTREVSAAVNKMVEALEAEMASSSAGRNMPASFMAACAGVLVALVAARVKLIQTTHKQITSEEIIQSISKMAVMNLPEARRLTLERIFPNHPGTDTPQ